MASKPAYSSCQKRKAPEGSQATTSLARKRQKTQAIRAIPSQSTDAALSATGELNVASFVKAREYEINALEKSMQNTRHGLATRAFQQVPRNMRRRTASHNVKKVPRRLRRRADKEMKEDNTPTVTSRRRTPSTKMRLRLETVKRIKLVTSKYKSARARKKEAKRNAGETDPEAHVSTTLVPRMKQNRLADPPTATSKFKKRQIHKTWLPTHLWHVKRAHMTKPSEPLWRMALPLSPTEKSCRPSHRASGGRGAVAWDMSYMATIGCEGVEPSLIAMLKAIGFGGDHMWGAKGNKWRKGVRSASGWASERDNEKRLLTPITVLWEAGRVKDTAGGSKNPIAGPIACGKQNTAMDNSSSSPHPDKVKSTKRKLLLRVHPSAFHQLWTELFKVAKLQRPRVMLEDLRFEVASIEIVGPASTEALCAVLQPTTPPDVSMPCSAGTWAKIAGLTNPATLPLGAIIGFNISDPRLTHPREFIAVKADDSSNEELTDLIVEWPPDDAPPQAGVFSHKARRTASRSLPSQKAINRRRGLTLPGEGPESRDTDPQIPTIVLASRPNASASGAQGTWIVLLPWKCLDPIWRCLMYYPLSSGGTVRFGGLDETRQIAFERNEPWFPSDFPGTEAGKSWERTEAEKRYNIWKRKPPSRRVNYDALRLGDEKKGEHGNGWACDWEFLLGLDTDKSSAPSAEEPHQSSDDIPSTESRPATDTNTVESRGSVQATSKMQTSSPALASTFSQLAPAKAPTLLNPSPNTIPASLPDKPCLATIRISLLTRGTPSPCARIYRLPSPPPSSTGTSPLHSAWLALDPHSNPTNTCPRTRKTKTNWRGDTTTHTTYADEYADIDAINYRPPNMVPEAIAEVERKKGQLRAQREGFLKQKFEMRAREQELPDGEDSGDMTAEEREALMRELMRPCADKHAEDALAPECPGVGDLIGFVTSGGYNLRVGRGTGVGAVWVQRVLGGWGGARDVTSWPSNGALGIKRLERERRLCVVRNAGEGVARLGLWELCE